MYPDHLALSDRLKAAHGQSWQAIAKAGDFFTGAERVAFVHAARAALSCSLCSSRLAALSPFSLLGEHADEDGLDPVIVDVIHRIAVDPGRLTRAWFDEVTRHISQKEYVEIVSVVATSVIIDTLHNAVGLSLARLPAPQEGNPAKQFNTAAVAGGAWVPMLTGEDTLADTGMPRVPNIARSLGLVPSALTLFFNTFRPHYALKDIDLSISQAQAEFIAARVSAMNECFY